MPIYAYKCATCGHADDVMQKMSDAALTMCPECGADSYAKQLTAPGFALKGSGWYVTDFRGGGNAAAKPAADVNTESKGDSKTSAPAAPSADNVVAAPSSAVPAAPVSKPTASAPSE